MINLSKSHTNHIKEAQKIMGLWNDFVRQLPDHPEHDRWVAMHQDFIKKIDEFLMKEKSCSVCKHCYLKNLYEYPGHWDAHEFCNIDDRPTGYETDRKTCERFVLRGENDDEN